MNVLTCPKCGSKYDQHPLTPAAQELCPTCRNGVPWGKIKTVLAAAGTGTDSGAVLHARPERPATSPQLTARERLSIRFGAPVNPFAPRTDPVAPVLPVAQAAFGFSGAGSYSALEINARPGAEVSVSAGFAPAEKTEPASANPFVAIPVRQLRPGAGFERVFSTLKSVNLELQPKVQAALAVEKEPVLAMPECGG